MYSILKRFFDIIISLFTLLILLPFLLPVIIMLRFTSEGEIFYFQKRIGHKNKSFLIYKFATMLKNSSKMKNGYITTKNDPRFTYLGSFLRKTKINELPQLINILLGDMSIVGPRPLMKVSFDYYSIEVKKLIYNVKPGLTGIGSIIFRDEEELITNVKNEGGDILSFYKEKIFPFKGKLELWYQNKRSFLIDFLIILVTAWVIIKPNSKIYEFIFKDLPKRDF